MPARRTFSVIIPTLDDPLIEMVVAGVRRELDERAEYIVVGRTNSDALRRMEGVRFLETERPVGASEARNRGIRAASGDWLIFVDADCLVEPRWGDALMARLTAGERVVGGGVTFPPDSHYWMLAYNLTMFHEFHVSRPAGPKRYLPTLNLAVHRDVVERVGLMDERLERGQDIDWTIRMALAGYRLYFEPRAPVAHYPQRTGLGTVWRYWVRSGRYNSRNRIKYAGYYHTPRLLRHPRWVRALAPVVSAYVTAGIFWRSPHLLRHIHTLPVVYLTKIAWCLGAAEEAEQCRSDVASS